MSRSRVPEQYIIVHEQNQPPWVPNPRRLGLCSYKDKEAEARVPPLPMAEEDSLAPFGIGEGSARRKVRRTIRRFFMSGQTYYPTVQRVWNPAREAQRIEQQQRRQRHRRYWQALAKDICEFRDGGSSALRTCCYSLASGNSPQRRRVT